MKSECKQFYHQSWFDGKTHRVEFACSPCGFSSFALVFLSVCLTSEPAQRWRWRFVNRKWCKICQKKQKKAKCAYFKKVLLILSINLLQVVSPLWEFKRFVTFPVQTRWTSFRISMMHGNGTQCKYCTQRAKHSSWLGRWWLHREVVPSEKWRRARAAFKWAEQQVHQIINNEPQLPKPPLLLGGQGPGPAPWHHPPHLHPSASMFQHAFPSYFPPCIKHLICFWKMPNK